LPVCVVAVRTATRWSQPVVVVARTTTTG